MSASTKKPDDTGDETGPISRQPINNLERSDKQSTGAFPDFESLPKVASLPVDIESSLAAAFGDRYEIGESLGKGGFGKVFRALDRRLNRWVAIKASRSRTSDPEQLLREARALAQFRHPGIIAIFDVATTADYCFVVSELLPGPTLSQWLRDRTLSPAEAVRIAAEVADSLAHAHERSIIHRDIKPSNIMFGAGQRPVLLDFGLAITDMDTAAERGVVAGTPTYMAPEQALGRSHRPDGRTDIYGLAATLYEMICGRPPFRGASSLQILEQVIEDEPQPPRQIRPEIPVELDRAVLRGMAKLPGDRFTTAADFATAIRMAVGLLPALTSAPPAPPVPPPVKPLAPSIPPEVKLKVPRTERRQITVLHCTCEASDSDADPLEKVAIFQANCREQTFAHSGLPLQTSGGTFAACFGYPLAHEDAPRQAVRAALEIARNVEAAPILVGVATGLAVITESPGSPAVVVGDAMALATTVAAQPSISGVVIAGATYRIVEGYFECEPDGEIRPRGSASAVKVYRVVGEREVRSRIEAADPTKLTPLVGRQREVELLLEHWDRTTEGLQGVVLLVGDPGLGKSRLVRVLREQVSRQSPSAIGGSDSTRTGEMHGAVIEWACSPHHESSPFFPVTSYFERAYHLARETDPSSRLNQLIIRLQADGIHDHDDLAVFAAMLSIPTGERLPALNVTPERLKEKIEDVLLRWLSGRGELTPVLFVVEDLHWIDPSTDALLRAFVESGGAGGVLGVFTFRPEYDPPWKGKSVQTQIALNRLTRVQIAEMIRAQTGTLSIPQDAIDRIVERTDGVPLFVEEFTKLLVDGGLQSAAIPATLQDLLLARLDRMASDRGVVQLAAVIGRSFRFEVLRAASDRDEGTLRAELAKLVAAGLLFAKGSPPRSTYTFKHALIQDAAYQSLVKKQRLGFHHTVAEALRDHFPEMVENQPEVLAHHFAEASEFETSIGYWKSAGSLAAARFANAEAIQHYQRGLLAIAAIRPSQERDQLELDLQVPLATAITVARGWAAPDAEAVHERAAEICRNLGPGAPTFHVAWGRWAWRLLRGELDTADALARELWEMAQKADASYVVETCFAICCTANFRGEFARAIEFGRFGIDRFDRERSQWHARFTGQNAGCTIRAHWAWALWAVGQPLQALAVAEEGVELGKSLNDQFSEAFATYHLGCVQQHMRKAEAARACGERAVAIGAEQGFGIWTALGTLCRGSGIILGGHDLSAGLNQVRQGIEAFRATGATLSLSHYFGVLAEAYQATGDIANARKAIEEGLGHAARTNERFQEANLYRLRGELLIAEEPRAVTEAEADYRRALDLARQQGALSWQLRTAISLARLRRDGLPPSDAREILAGVVARLSEGFDTPDMINARMLLDEMVSTLSG